jgi:subfamily B ATP-binding cassette protein MsbA
MASDARKMNGGLTILQLLRPHRKVLWLGLLAICGESIADLLKPWPLKIVLDNVISHKTSHGCTHAPSCAMVRRLFWEVKV